MAEKKVPQEVPEYDLQELLENSEALFNVKPEIVHGAIHGNEKERYSVDEMRKLIEKFLKRRTE